MKLVVDASVALKWFFKEDEAELDVVPTVDILTRFTTGDLTLIAPCHFIAELCAVIARREPDSMEACLADLLNLNIPVRDDPVVLARAMRLAHEFDHHLFDTLYHALALEDEEAVLVTADKRYWRKARTAGRIVELADWTVVASSDLSER